MDLIFSGSLFINEIAEIPVIHCLCSLNNAEKKDIKTIVSHPQALEQCSEYIEKNNFSVISFSDTASAAEYVKNLGDISVASLSSKTAAELNGLKIIEEEVNDSPNNITRFASFSRVKELPSPDSRNRDENFILVFTAENQAGSLAGALNIIGAHGYNMRTLRSRPMKSLQWNYYFYIEADGMPVIFNTAIKPTPSIGKPQNTVDFINKKDAKAEIKGRHDPAIIRRICPVIDSVTALVICDLLSIRYGTDYLSEG